jgi:hypothetical protein
MIILICIIFYPFASFDPMVDGTTFLIVRNACQNCHYLSFGILFVSPPVVFWGGRTSRSPRLRDWGLKRMRDSPALHSSHFIDNHMCRVARRIVKMQAQLATSIMPSRSGMELVQWRDHFSYKVVCEVFLRTGIRSCTKSNETPITIQLEMMNAWNDKASNQQFQDNLNQHRPYVLPLFWASLDFSF